MNLGSNEHTLASFGQLGIISNLFLSRDGLDHKGSGNIN